MSTGGEGMKIELTEKETMATYANLSHSLMELGDTEERELIESVMTKLKPEGVDSEKKK